MNFLRSATCAALAAALLATLGCSGSNSSSPAGNAGSGSGASGTGGSGTSANNLSGVAASGDPLAGATVTLKDQNGNVRTATTASDGSFSVDVTGLTAPFLLQVASTDGTTTYYSASASAASTNPTANLDQYTDLALRAYYAALNSGDVSSVFASVSAATVLPAQADLSNLADALNDMLQPTLTADGVASAGSFNIFDTAFTANQAGFDALLHDTTYTSAGSGSSSASFSISTSGANGAVLTQSDTVTVVSGQISFSGTNTSQANGGTAASTSAFDTISVAAGSAQQQTDEQAALTGIQTLWSNLVATAQSKGAALSGSDLAAYFDSHFSESTLNAAQFETYLANRLIAYVTSGQATGSIGQVYAFSDPPGGAVQITAQTLLTVSTGSGSYSVDMSPNEGVDGGLGLGYIQESDGSYALYGNQDIAETAFQVATSAGYSNCVGGGADCPNQTGNALTSLHLTAFVPFATPYGGTGPGDLTVSSVTVANTGTNAALPSCNPTYTLGTAPLTLSEALNGDNAQVLTGVYGQEAVLFLDTGIGSCAPDSLVLPAPFPPAGTEYQITYNEASGTTQTTNLFMNAQTSESLQLQSINGESPDIFLSSNSIAAGGFTGTSLSLSWPLPVTFALRSISVTVEAYDNASCTALAPESASFLSPTATGDTITLPVPGTGAEYRVTLGFNGADGESVADGVTLYSAVPTTLC